MAGIAGVMTADGAAPKPARLETLAAIVSRRGRFGTRHNVIEGVGLIEVAVGNGAADQSLPVMQDGSTFIIDGGIGHNAKHEDDTQGCVLPKEPQRSQDDAESIADGVRGGFAFTYFDQTDGSLTLARDPFGIKTLYYTEDRSGLAFASEPEALIEAGFATRRIGEEPCDELLQMQFCTGRETIYPGIHRVLGGETLRIFSGRIVSRSRRSALPEGGPANWNEDEALDRLGRALADSVDAHLSDSDRFDLFLSGGVDSAALLAALAQRGQLPRQIFTAVLARGEASEEIFEYEFARRQAKRLGVDHVELHYGEAEFWGHLPGIVDMLDDPTADHRVLPLYLLAREASASSGVVLLGDGGDELFAGYGRHRGVVRPWYLGGPKVIRPRGQFDRMDLLRREPSAWRDGIRAAESLENHVGRSKLQVAQAIDCSDWLPNDVLLKLDRCLSHHGLEGRFPILDRGVAEVAFALPDGLKVKKDRGKYLLRRWLQQVEPEAQPFARKRRATPPIGDWIFGSGARLGPLVAAQPGVDEVARPDRVVALFLKGGRREAFAAWSLLFYALWHRRHVLGLASHGDVFETLATTS